MSSSATSSNDTDSSAARAEKRPLTPVDPSCTAKKSRSNSGDQHTNSWEVDTPSTTPASSKREKPSVETCLENPKVQLPSIFTTFEDKFRNEPRRASLPTLYSESASRRHAPYPPTGGRPNYPPVNQSSLSTYQFPQSSDSNSYADSPYPNSALSNGTNSSSSTFPPSATSTFTSPLSPDYRPGLSPQYPEHREWNSPTIVRPSSTPSQLSATSAKYEDGLRHASFSAPLSQNSQMFAGSTRISGQDRTRSLSAGVKGEWSFPATDFVLSPSAPTYPSS